MDEIATSLRQHGISKEEKNRLHGEREEIKAMISNAKTEQKDKANNVKQKRQAFMTAKKNQRI